MPTSDSAHYHVLLYHGVYDGSVNVGARNSSGKHIPLARFEAQMEHLASSRPLVTMGDVAAAHRGERSLPDGAVALTFDDGYLNNYTVAWPILEHLRIPATFYLATGYIGAGRMIWTDLLEATILRTLQQELSLRLDSESLNFPLASTADRLAAFHAIKARCKAASDAVKKRIVGQVCQALDVDVSSDHPLYAFMNWNQVREMDASPLVDFGAHSVDHVSLAKVAPDVCRDQIDRSVANVAEKLGHPCRFFSFPEGGHDDFNDEIIEMLRARGFDHAPSAIPGVNRLGEVDPFRIHRTAVGFGDQPFPFADL